MRQNRDQPKRRRRVTLYALLFLGWALIGCCLFIHMWENRHEAASSEEQTEPKPWHFVNNSED